MLFIIPFNFILFKSIEYNAVKNQIYKVLFKIRIKYMMIRVIMVIVRIRSIFYNHWFQFITNQRVVNLDSIHWLILLSLLIKLIKSINPIIVL